MATSVIRIDNVDPRIFYSGTWTTHDSTNGYNHTISLTRRVGNSATLSFVGNSVAAFGQLGKHPPNAPAITQYQVDNEDPTTFAPPSPSTDLTRLLFYQSPALSYGPHKLVMTNMMDLDWIWFDYFEITTIEGQQPQPPPPGPIITAPSSPNTSGPTPSASTPGSPVVSTTLSTTSTQLLPSSNGHTQSLITSTTLSTADQLQSFTPAPAIPIGAPTFIASSQGISSSHKAPTGAIVGGVIGGLLFLTIIGTILVVCMRRKRRIATHDDSAQDSVDHLFPPPSRDIETREGYPARERVIRGGPDTVGDGMSSSHVTSAGPLSASTITETMYTTRGRDTGALPVSKARLQLATIASPEMPLPPYSVY